MSWIHDGFARLARLLPSARPDWAMMPTGAATHFTDLLLFVASALEEARIDYVVHYGSLLGAARLGAPLPWDEDHDLFLIDVTIDAVEARLAPVMRAHGYRMTRDPRGFLWVREAIWPAASGHLSLTVLPALAARPEDLPVWEGGAPHLAEGELRDLQRLPIYGSFVLAPQKTEQILARLYGASAGEEAMRAFRPPRIRRAAQDFWARARTPDRLDWPAISARFRGQARWRPVLSVPWWWFNGSYILAINALKRWARRRIAADRNNEAGE
ncbi:LicD family protein [Aquabacter spiritensis]|uniref:LicD family protein n=1 Tax=Aquabacter spiritensis TaxID=933073 RepID=A0A4R3LY29_9HYPH|nr:LicD family protein [Aquabacter spiritensis]TCT05591.1 LicD family protein [Aquabacter spiritensis]